MNLDVEAFLADARPSFRPWAHYHKAADSLQVYVADEPTKRRRIDSILTVYETEAGEFGGCMIKDVSKLLQDCQGLVGLTIRKGEKVKVRLVIMAYILSHPETIESSGRQIRRVLEAAGDEELCLRDAA